VPWGPSLLVHFFFFKLIYFSFFFFFFLPDWGLNLGPRSCQIGPLPLEPYPSPNIYLFIFYYVYFCGTGDGTQVNSLPHHHPAARFKRIAAPHLCTGCALSLLSWNLSISLGLTRSFWLARSLHTPLPNILILQVRSPKAELVPAPPSLAHILRAQREPRQ
jgi:hypothetical protein